MSEINLDALPAELRKLANSGGMKNWLLREAADQLDGLIAEVRKLREQVAHPPLLYQADADGSNLRLVEKAIDPDSELIVVHEVRLLREQRDKVLALCDEHSVCCEWLATDVETVYGVSGSAQEQTEDPA